LTDIGQVASFAPNPIGNVIIPQNPLSAMLVKQDQPNVKQDQPTPEQENSAPLAGRAHPAHSGAVARQEATGSTEAAPGDSPSGVAPHPLVANGPERIAGATEVPPTLKSNEPASKPEAVSRGASLASQPVIVLVWVSHTRSG
jgi:hypothetical protein